MAWCCVFITAKRSKTMGLQCTEQGLSTCTSTKGLLQLVQAHPGRAPRQARPAGHTVHIAHRAHCTLCTFGRCLQEAPHVHHARPLQQGIPAGHFEAVPGDGPLSRMWFCYCCALSLADLSQCLAL